MFDYTILDGRTFEELHRALYVILEKIDAAEDRLSDDDEDDPFIDALYTIADNIIGRMDSVIRESAHISPENLAKWSAVMRDYEAGYARYTDAVLEDDTLLDFEPPENP